MDKGILIIIGITVVVFAGIMIGPVLKSRPIEGLKVYAIEDRNHVNEKVNYPQSPPAGGNHASVWPGCNGETYDQPVPNENAVHGLEHGAVWVTYKPDLDPKQVESLKQKVTGSQYTFSSPYQDQQSPIVLTAWNNQLEVTSVDDSRFGQFMSKYRQGDQTPEPGATCASQGSMGSQPGAPAGSSGLNPGETAEEHAKESQQ